MTRFCLFSSEEGITVRLPQNVGAKICRYMEGSCICENCREPVTVAIVIKKFASVGSGSRPYLYDSRYAMDHHAEILAGEEADMAAQDLAARLENAILHNIKILAGRALRFGPIC